MSENKYDYKADLLVRLKELQYAQLYLEAAAKESQETFLLALRDVAEVQKGMAQLAVEADVNRENLYRALSEDGNPTLSTLTSVLDALGMELLPSLKHIVPTSLEPSPRTIEHSETDSVRINLETGNTLQSGGLSLSNSIFVTSAATMSAGFATPSAYRVNLFGGLSVEPTKPDDNIPTPLAWAVIAQDQAQKSDQYLEA
jgi:probable addiction module antidote protein